MKLHKLNLTNFRGIKQLDIDFESDITVLAGVNGVGKSSILNALSVLLSQTLPKFTPSKSKSIHFIDEDIYWNYKYISALTLINIEDIMLNSMVWYDFSNEQSLIIQQDLNEGEFNQTNYTDILMNRKLTGDFKTGVKETLDKLNQFRFHANSPLAIFFSTRRQLPGKPGKLSAMAPLSPTDAYNRSLEDREVTLRDFLMWYRAQESISINTKNKRSNILNSLLKAIQLFLPEFTGINVVEYNSKTSLQIQKRNQIINSHQLSDGERGLLALVLDITRRLSIANPSVDDPIKDGIALVMIDEIELHLHPDWQRSVISRLMKVFPNCQFIVTTHSPQVLGQVEPKNIRLLSKDESGEIVCTTPTQSFGMDSNWILQHIMGTNHRERNTEKKLDEIYHAIDNEQYNEALSLVTELRNSIGDFPDLQGASAMLDSIRLLEGK